MSDSLNIVFHSPSRCDVSPIVYLHWGGNEILSTLKAALPRMRSGDPGYACARFIGHCHNEIAGMNSLGVTNLCNPIAQRLADDHEAYGLLMKGLAESDLLRVNVDVWILEGLGAPVQLPREDAGRADGVPGPNKPVHWPENQTMQNRARIAAEIQALESQWSGMDRSCPKCNTIFRSKGNRGACTNCGHVFYASHPDGGRPGE